MIDGLLRTRHRRRHVPRRHHRRRTAVPARQPAPGRGPHGRRARAGVEKAAALITTVFLHGTERRQDATADDRATDGDGVMARKASTS